MEIALVVIIIGLISIAGGMTGVGGVLFIPTLVVVMGMDTHVATGTVLASMILPSIYACFLYARRGAFDKNLVFSLGLGGLLSGYAGGALKVHVSGDFITIVLAMLVIVAGISSLRTHKAGSYEITGASMTTQRLFLFSLGAGVGILSGLAGCGGGVLTIPIMIYMGFPVAATVCAGIVYTVPAGVSASIPNIMHGYLDYHSLVWITLVQFVGLHAGVLLASKIPTDFIRKMVAGICIFTGLFLIVRTAL